MRRFDGTYNWFLARTQLLRDKKGAIVKWFGTCTNIQEQREIFEELKKVKENLSLSNKDLKESNDELSRINQELHNFVYSVSHDLKAPLNNIEGLIALLEAFEESKPEQAKLLDLIGESVQRFKEVVDDMTLIAETAKDKGGFFM